MALKTYFDFAENDLQHFMNCYERGDISNIMGAIAQGICEKYMKHLIDSFDCPTNKQDLIEKEKSLKSHNLNRLMKYVRDQLGEEFSTEIKREMKIIDGFYFSARYPGEESVELDQEDISHCAAAVIGCRNETIEIYRVLAAKEQEPEHNAEYSTANSETEQDYSTIDDDWDER